MCLKGKPVIFSQTVILQPMWHMKKKTLHDIRLVIINKMDKIIGGTKDK